MLLQVSDAILDALLEQDPESKVCSRAQRAAASLTGRSRMLPLEPQPECARAAIVLRKRGDTSIFPLISSGPARVQVACETCTKTNMVMVFGEITTKATVDYEAIVRKTCREIGFTSADVGLDADKCKVRACWEREPGIQALPSTT